MMRLKAQRKITRVTFMFCKAFSILDLFQIFSLKRGFGLSLSVIEIIYIDILLIFEKNLT